MTKELLSIPSNWLRKAISSLFALPLTGGAATFTRKIPPEKPTIWLLAALG